MITFKVASILLFSVFASEAFSVVYKNTDDKFSSVVPLGGRGYCSGVVVGLHPPTIITAKHCSEKHVVQYMNVLPDVIVTEEFEGKEFSTERAILPGDLAVLIFADSHRPLFEVRVKDADLFTLEAHSLTAWQKIEVCGYGGSEPELGNINGVNFQRCGTNRLIVDQEAYDFAGSVNKYFKPFNRLSNGLMLKGIHTTIQGNLQEYGAGTRLGMGALLPPTEKSPLGSFDEFHSQTLLQRADSGGPAFVRNMAGDKVLIGVNSMALFAGDQVRGAIFWRVDQEWSQRLLLKARNLGADIRGLK